MLTSCRPKLSFFTLQVGWPGGGLLTETEQRAHFGIWAILKAPLIFGNDLRWAHVSPNKHDPWSAVET